MTMTYVQERKKKGGARPTHHSNRPNKRKGADRDRQREETALHRACKVVHVTRDVHSVVGRADNDELKDLEPGRVRSTASTGKNEFTKGGQVSPEEGPRADRGVIAVQDAARHPQTVQTQQDEDIPWELAVRS